MSAAAAAYASELPLIRSVCHFAPCDTAKEQRVLVSSIEHGQCVCAFRRGVLRVRVACVCVVLVLNSNTNPVQRK